MSTRVRRAADKALGAFLPEAEAKADHWGAFCGCQGYCRYYERWTYVNASRRTRVAAPAILAADQRDRRRSDRGIA